jgi:uncharacterized membrane protein YccC
MHNLPPKNDNHAPTGSDLARELRLALDALGALVEDANEHVCTVEDAHGLEFTGRDETPDAREQGRARANLAAALDALGKSEDAMRQQLWMLDRARRALARIARTERAVQ